MPRILVTPLSALQDAIENHRPSHIVTLLSPEHMIETPAGFAAERHLKLGVNDVAGHAGSLFCSTAGLPSPAPWPRPMPCCATGLAPAAKWKSPLASARPPATPI